MSHPAELYFLTAGVAVLRFLESWTDKPVFLKQNPARILFEEIISVSALVCSAAVYLLGIRFLPFLSDAFTLLIFPALYFIFRAGKLPISFTAGVFAFLSLFVFPVEILLVGDLIKSAGEFAIGVMIFRFALEGIRFRLLFSNVPKPFKGFGIFLISAGLVSIAISVLFVGLR